MDGNSQKQTDLQTSTLSSSSSGDPSSSDSSSDPEPTFTPFPAHSAAQSPDSDSSSDNQCDNERQVRFRSYESIRYFHEDTPTGSPSLYPNTHRRKTRFRKKPFPPDTYISCGRSIFETREEDSIHEFHSGNYGRSEDYFLWDDMLQEQRVVSKLKRSNTVPSSAQRSFSKDEACGFKSSINALKCLGLMLKTG
ncbi:hypothetical protein BGZ47_000085 [Haplosporangium gracile]|nr:hypothetical protein BGZ47_000085 [Haplosporangium gracile]